MIGSISKTVAIAGEEVSITVPSNTTWKIENGKWVWYADAKEATWATPVGPSLHPVRDQIAAPGPATRYRKTRRKDPGAVAQSILQELSVDKKEITLDAGNVSEGKVIFHNGMTGSVQLELASPEVPGLTVTTAQSIVRAGTDMPVLFHYEPADPSRGRGPITVQITVQPVNRMFAIRGILPRRLP